MAIPLTLALTYFNFVGANAARVVLTLYALELGAPASSVGVLGGLLFLFPLLLSWPIGALADRTGARGILLFASCCGAASLVLPFLVRAVPAFYVAAALKKSIEAYRVIAGFDISQNPGITATLYNVGNPDARAYALKRENEERAALGEEPRFPEENYYGWLVNEKLPELQALF